MSALSPNRYYINSAACEGMLVNINITHNILQNVVVNIYCNVQFRCTVLLSTLTVIIMRNCSACHLFSPHKEIEHADIFLPFVKLKGHIDPAGIANKKRGATDIKGAN